MKWAGFFIFLVEPAGLAAADFGLGGVTKRADDFSVPNEMLAPF
jgi:hypothetical protein